MTHVSRRKFLVTSVLSAGGVALAAEMGGANAAPVPAAEPQWDEEFDVIVVGSGLAGTTAAVAARKNGCERVVILEKMPVIGGSSAIAAGEMSAVNSPISIKAGVKDSVDLYVEDVTKAGENYNKKELTRAVAETTGRGIAFLLEHGAEFKEKPIPSFGHSAPRVHQSVNGCGRSVLAPLRESFLNTYKGELRTRVKMDSLICNAEGRVIGVAARERYNFDQNLESDDLENKSGRVKHYRALHGVIMANGGYGRDIVFRKKDYPLISPAMVQTATLGSTGGGVRAMMSIGARPFGLSFMRYGFFISGGDTRIACMVHPKTGKRFINEAQNRAQIANVAMGIANECNGQFPVALFDTDGVARFEDPVRTRRILKQGLLRAYDSLEELVKKENLPLEGVLATAKSYNAIVDAGKDTEFGKDMKLSLGAKLLKAPFYASTVVPNAGTVTGGISVTPLAEVIRASDDQPIPGLYAAGECTAGTNGQFSLHSTNMPVALCLGLIAGEQVALHAKKQK